MAVGIRTVERLRLWGGRLRILMRRFGLANEVSSSMFSFRLVSKSIGIVDEVSTEHIVLEGTLLKFRQNPHLRRLLDATGDKMIVEASPLDKIWGIGLGEKEALEKGEKGWRGLNLLGKALMQARAILRDEAKSQGG